MLLLDVKPGERVQIGPDIVLTVEKKSGQVSRIAFDAPTALRIKLLPPEQSEAAAARKGIAR